jgi:hypothetical protein
MYDYGLTTMVAVDLEKQLVPGLRVRTYNTYTCGRVVRKAKSVAADRAKKVTLNKDR